MSKVHEQNPRDLRARFPLANHRHHPKTHPQGPGSLLLPDVRDGGKEAPGKYSTSDVTCPDSGSPTRWNRLRRTVLDGLACHATSLIWTRAGFDISGFSINISFLTNYWHTTRRLRKNIFSRLKLFTKVNAFV